MASSSCTSVYSCSLEKALDLVEFTGSVTQAIPGPRVGGSSLPWILAVPLAYFGITFVIAFVKTVRKFNSPRAKRRKLVNKNAFLCKSIDELFEKGRQNVDDSELKDLMKKTNFEMEDILRKYIRYALNEKPFNPDLVADLIQLRKASLLSDSQVAGILNEISSRIVKDKGPVVMDMSGYSEKGFKRKLAVQALFGKIYYLSEAVLNSKVKVLFAYGILCKPVFVGLSVLENRHLLMPEFCSRDSSLTVKEIFGVAETAVGLEHNNVGTLVVTQNRDFNAARKFSNLQGNLLSNSTKVHLTIFSCKEGIQLAKIYAVSPAVCLARWGSIFFVAGRAYGLIGPLPLVLAELMKIPGHGFRVDLFDAGDAGKVGKACKLLLRKQRSAGKK
nr:uncharacterized protein LOC109159507 [Ipomoea trifida]